MRSGEAGGGEESCLEPDFVFIPLGPSRGQELKSCREASSGEAGSGCLFPEALPPWPLANPPQAGNRPPPCLSFFQLVLHCSPPRKNVRGHCPFPSCFLICWPHMLRKRGDAGGGWAFSARERVLGKIGDLVPVVTQKNFNLLHLNLLLVYPNLNIC